MRIAVGVEYTGTRYAGWQRQDAVASVQQALETALARVADHPVALVCAGRTDAGVHALGQVAHFETDAVRSPRGWVMGTNGHLPRDIALTSASPVSDEFHARYSALARTYRYLVLNRPAPSALLRDRAYWLHALLDVPAMARAARALVGEHDFSAFRAAECQSRTAVRRMESVRVTRAAELVVFEVTANAFLHHMVRNIVGTLLAVGTRERGESWPAEVLAARERRLAGITAPAAGLYFARVRYPERFAVPAPSSGLVSAIIGAH